MLLAQSPPMAVARFEGRIVQQLIRNDGGTGDFKEVTPRMLGIWDTILKVGFSIWGGPE